MARVIWYFTLESGYAAMVANVLQCRDTAMITVNDIFNKTERSWTEYALTAEANMYGIRYGMEGIVPIHSAWHAMLWCDNTLYSQIMRTPLGRYVKPFFNGKIYDTPGITNGQVNLDVHQLTYTVHICNYDHAFVYEIMRLCSAGCTTLNMKDLSIDTRDVSCNVVVNEYSQHDRCNAHRTTDYISIFTHIDNLQCCNNIKDKILEFLDIFKAVCTLSAMEHRSGNQSISIYSFVMPHSLPTPYIAQALLRDIYYEWEEGRPIQYLEQYEGEIDRSYPMIKKCIDKDDITMHLIYVYQVEHIDRLYMDTAEANGRSNIMQYMQYIAGQSI
jgi:hypothetical protein